MTLKILHTPDDEPCVTVAVLKAFIQERGVYAVLGELLEELDTLEEELCECQQKGQAAWWEHVTTRLGNFASARL